MNELERYLVISENKTPLTSTLPITEARSKKTDLEENLDSTEIVSVKEYKRMKKMERAKETRELLEKVVSGQGTDEDIKELFRRAQDNPGSGA